jgi:hypothetical protein
MHLYGIVLKPTDDCFLLENMFCSIQVENLKWKHLPKYVQISGSAILVGKNINKSRLFMLITVEKLISIKVILHTCKT